MRRLLLALLLAGTVAHAHAQVRELSSVVRPLDGSTVGDVTSVAVTATSPITGTSTCTGGACSFTLGLAAPGAGSELVYRSSGTALGAALGSAVTAGTGAITLTSQGAAVTPLTIVPDAGQTAPLIILRPDVSNVGITSPAIGYAQFMTYGVGGPALSNNSIRLGDASQLLFASTQNPMDSVADTGLARASAGVVKVTDGSTGAGSILVADGSAAAPSVAFASAPTTGFSATAAPLLEINVAAVRQGYFQSDGYLWMNSGLANGNGSYFRSDAAAQWRAGAAANATPVANTLIVGESGSGTDIAGANGVIQSGAGTGSGAGSTLIFQTPTPGGSGSGAQTQATRMLISASNGVEFWTNPFPRIADSYQLGGNGGEWQALYLNRATLGSKSKTLTDASATDFATIALADGTMTGGEIIYRVTATISGEKQVLAGRVRYTAIREGTTYDCDVSEVGTQTNSQKSGTLTGAITCAAAAGVLTFSANFDSSLTAPTVTLHYRFDSTDAATSITPL